MASVHDLRRDASVGALWVEGATAPAFSASPTPEGLHAIARSRDGAGRWMRVAK